MADYQKHPPTSEEVTSFKETGYDPRTGKKIKKKTELYEFLMNYQAAAPIIVKVEPEWDSFGGRSLLSSHTENKAVEPASLYTRDGRVVIFDATTMNKYVTVRKQRWDIVCYCPMEDKGSIFEYPYQWDSYTGERLLDATQKPILDPYGAFCFDVNSLIYWWHSRRLEGLWVGEQQLGNEMLQGHYGDYLGTGQQIRIVSRGDHPEWYLFRLPVTDCYLFDGYDRSIPTMGPRMTNEDIKNIYEIASNNKVGGRTQYETKFRVALPNLVEMKRLYDLALNPTPSTQITSSMSREEVIMAHEQINREAVEALKRLK